MKHISLVLLSLLAIAVMITGASWVLCGCDAPEHERVTGTITYLTDVKVRPVDLERANAQLAIPLEQSSEVFQ